MMRKTCRSFQRSGLIRRGFLAGVRLVLFFFGGRPVVLGRSANHNDH